MGLDCKRTISWTNVFGIQFGKSCGNLVLKILIVDGIRTMANSRKKVELKKEIEILLFLN